MKQLKDVPFALIGINSDKDVEVARKAVKSNNLNWRSFQDDAGVEGVISESWGVQTWPSVFILDEKGVIRWRGKGALEGANDALIEELLAEMGHVVEIRE